MNNSAATKESTGNEVAVIENGVSENLPNDKKSKNTRQRGVASFEKALSETKFGKFNFFIILISGFVLSNVLLETLAIGFILPVSSCDLELTIQHKGILSAIGFVGIISSSHLWGFLADTTGRRRVIRPTLIMGFIITVISSFSNSFWLLVILRYLNGVFISGGSAVIYAYLGEFHTENTRSRAIMGASMIFGIGAMFLPIVAWAVINGDWSFEIALFNITYKPWRLLMVVCGIPGFLCGLCLFAMPESPKFLLSVGREEESMEILKCMFHANTGQSKDEYPVKSIAADLESTMKRKNSDINKSKNPVLSVLRAMWEQTSPLFSKEFILKTSLTCSLQFWIFVTSNGMYLWFPFILNAMMEFISNHPGKNAYICEVVNEKLVYNGTEEAITCNEKLEISTFQHSLALEVMYAVGFAFMGFIINKVGKVPLLFSILVGCGACGVAAIYVDSPMLSVYLYIILLCCGLAIAVVNAATVELFPTHLRAMAVCISLMMGRLGSVVGTNIVGFFLETSCEGTFLFCGISLILAGFLGFLIPKPPKNFELRSRESSLVSMTGN